jgi:hypothetical protein
MPWFRVPSTEPVTENCELDYNRSIFFTLLSALSYSVVFMSTQSISQVFMETYDFLEYQAGLVRALAVIREALGFAAASPKMPVTPAQQNPNPASQKQTSRRFGCTHPGGFHWARRRALLVWVDELPVPAVDCPHGRPSADWFGVTLVMQGITRLFECILKIRFVNTLPTKPFDYTVRKSIDRMRRVEEIKCRLGDTNIGAGGARLVVLTELVVL